MNSLYGSARPRLGMGYEQADTRLVNSKQLAKLISNSDCSVDSIINLSNEGSDISLVSVLDNNKFRL